MGVQLQAYIKISYGLFSEAGSHKHFLNPLIRSSLPKNSLIAGSTRSTRDSASLFDFDTCLSIFPLWFDQRVDTDASARPVLCTWPCQILGSRRLGVCLELVDHEAGCVRAWTESIPRLGHGHDSTLES
jgi:hypothetical protein